MPQETPKCEICKGSMRPLTSRTVITASEWYCTKCHKSYPMSKDTATYFLNMQAQQQG